MVRKNSKEMRYRSLNIFISLIILVLIIQIVFSGFVIYELRGLNDKILSVSEDLSKSQVDLEGKINSVNADLQNKVSEVSKSLMSVEKDLGNEINSIKAETSADFSGIISNAVKSVVSIRTDVAQGTGFIISSDGYVVTNAHVLSGAKTASAITSGQEIKSVQLIGYNIPMDLALLKINGNYNYLEFGDSNNVVVGEKVIAIGNPLGLSFSVSEGIVSAVNREGENGVFGYIQTDAALNPGNSGGPLINTDGEVIGINNFKLSGDNLGFALESNYIEEVVNDIAVSELNMTIV